MKTSFGHKLLSIVGQKCPICGKGNVYEKRRRLIEMPRMHENCPACHYHFDREPGYFLGAMYTSYGLAVAEGILAFLLAYFLVPSISTISLALCVTAAIVVMSVWNYRMSRVIWMNLFPH